MAIDLYDTNRDGRLNQDELAQCPGMQSKIALYDKNRSGTIEQDEITQRLFDLFGHGTGATGLDALVYFNGAPLAGATVILEPEPYLGNEVKVAQGITNGSGSAKLSIPPEYIPEHLQRIKSVHYGTFKVRITHPTKSIPEKYNTKTELGYETEIGNPFARFSLSAK